MASRRTSAAAAVAPSKSASTNAKPAAAKTATAPQATESFRGTSKRERILRAAVDVFARNGYFNAKVSEIAKAAGVADGTIYLYFDGKE
ncbi:MAG TPA: helix-turn-helix domain-containing protein, partial [Thermoanaerobaculia bacterium]|nr:helix-turn-helix domain-containing protein [Thermoanaerobaculia bacterium]